MVKKIKRVARCNGEEGKSFLIIITDEGKNFKRRFKDNTRGRFKEKTTFNMWDNVYSFKTKEHDLVDVLTGKRSQWIECDGDSITYEGRYEEIYKTGRKRKKKVEETGFETPKEKEKEVEFEEKEVFHEKYLLIKRCIENSIPIYLAGPAGAGKNFTLEQIADKLGMNFYFTNSVQQEYKITGFVDAGGEYHETEFYKACKEASEGIDTIFFLDEMDASIPEVLVLLNAAIANGYFEFPNGKIFFGSKVHFVAAGNTVGAGADEEYSGRMVIDQATLDRFAIIDFDYDRNIENQLTKGNDQLIDFVRELRKEAKEKGIRATFSYRCLTMVTKLEKVLDLEDVIKIAVMKGLDLDTIKTFVPETQIGGMNKYVRALKRIKNEM